MFVGKLEFAFFQIHTSELILEIAYVSKIYFTISRKIYKSSQKEKVTELSILGWKNVKK